VSVIAVPASTPGALAAKAATTTKRLVGQAASVHKHPAEIVIYHRGSEIARHPRLIGQRDARHALPGHLPTSTRADRGPALEEQLLSGDHVSLERYAVALKQRAYGRGVRALRRLLELKRTYPAGPFLAAIDQALRFGLFDILVLQWLWSEGMDGGTGNESKPSIPEAARGLGRRSSVKARMRSQLVVIAPPELDDAACLAERVEKLLVEAFIAQPANEALGERVLLWRAGRDVVPGHAR
jgi:hypothetical protein